MLGTKEMYDVMEVFERTAKNFLYIARFDREDKSQWAQKHYYEHGETNNYFIAFFAGYQFHKSISNLEG